MKILLFDSNNILVKTLKDVSFAIHAEELNGENVLEIETYDEIEKGQYLVYKDSDGYWHEFLVKEVDEERAGAGPLKRVFAESSFYETIGDFIEDKRPSGTADYALMVALEPTRWQVGLVDDFGTNHTSFYRTSSKEAVTKIVETWGGELRTRIEISGSKVVGRYVDLLKNRGYDLGKRFTYTKDLTSIRKTVQREDVITALYGFGKGEELETGGYGRRINFSEINGGKMYLENNDARLIWGRGPEKAHVFGKVEFDDCEDIEELKELTQSELDIRSKPQITYEAKVVDLKAMGVTHEGVGLGDFVRVIDKEFKPELRLRAKVIKLVRDLLEPENTEITLGNFLPGLIDRTLEQEDHISNFRDKQGIWDRSGMFDRDGLDSSYLNGVIDVVKNRLESTQSKWWTDDNGNLIFEDKNGTSAMLLGGAGYMIAETKLPNGEWNWRTLGTGSGIIADVITAGILSGGKVRWDLEDGTLLIGESTEDFFLKWTGTDLYIKGDNIDLEGNESIKSRVTKEEILTDPDIQESLKGEPGQDAPPTYTWYRWADTPTSGISGNPLNKDYLGIAYNKPTPTPSNNYDDYDWVLVKGERGADGVSPDDKFFWVKYADDDNGTGMSDSPVGKRWLGVAENKDTLIESNDYRDYKWSPLYDNSVIMSATAPSSPNLAQLWLDTSAKPNLLKRWTGSEWEIISDVSELEELVASKASQEDLDGQIANVVASIQSSLESEISQTQETINFKFSEALTAIDEAGQRITDLSTELETNIRFTSEGIEIGKTTNPISVKILPDRVSFSEGGQEVAYFSNNKLYVTDIHVLTSLRIGDFAFFPRSSGNLSFKKVT